MSIPQTDVLVNKQSQQQEVPSAVEHIESSVEVQSPFPKDGLNVPAIPMFNDYVAILCVPNVRTHLVLPGNSDWSDVAVVVGFGKNCKNDFVLGQNVKINVKAAICDITDQHPSYEGRKIVMIQERNCYYEAAGAKLPVTVSEQSTE